MAEEDELRRRMMLERLRGPGDMGAYYSMFRPQRARQPREAPDIGMNSLQVLGSTGVPVLSDVAGLAGDVLEMVDDPTKRTLPNMGFAAAGLFPAISSRQARLVVDVFRRAGKKPRGTSWKLVIKRALEQFEAGLISEGELFRTVNRHTE